MRFNLHLLSVFSLAALLLASVKAGAAPEGLPQAVVPDGFGVNIHFTHFSPDELQKFKDIGFGYVRMDMHWDEVEKTPGVYDFSEFDTLLSDLDQAHARALLILDYGNPLYDKGLSPHTDAGRAAYARYAAAAAKHFVGRGVIFEIWNEPNNPAFWKPRPNVDEYAALVKPAVKAIREVDPSATILAGVTAGVPLKYIDSLLRSGAMDGVSALSVHPYRETEPESAAVDYAHVRAVIARYTPPGRPLLPIVSSEWGYSTATTHLSEPMQAAYVTREYLSNLACGVNMSTWYDWKDDGANPNRIGFRRGVLRRNSSLKPSYFAVQNFIQSLRGYTFRHRLVTANPDDYKLLFEGPSDLALVEWSADDNATVARQTPIISKVEPSDAQYSLLKRAAGIRFTPDVRVVTDRPSVPARIMVANPDDTPATVELSNLKQSLKLIVPPHETRMAFNSLSVNLDGPGPQPIDLQIKWNGKPISIIEPLEAVRGSLLDVQAAPAGADLSVTVSDPSPLPFDGKTTYRNTATGKITENPLSLAPGAQQTMTFLGAGFSLAKFEATANTGMPWALSEIDFIPDPDWAGANPTADRYKLTIDVKNSPPRMDAMNVEACSAPAPTPSALAVPYETGAGRHRFSVSPVGSDPIPEKARELDLWVDGDGTNAMLENQFVDSTGQHFEFKGVKIDWTGWKIVAFPLEGFACYHQGGAKDGVAHLPLNWESLVVIDGSNMRPQAGKILIASPSYAVK